MSITVKKPNRFHSKGFTLVELMLTIAMSTIIFLAAGVLLADGSGWFSKNYSKINSQPAIESMTSRRIFESTMRKATGQGYIVSSDGSFVEANYYSSGSNTIDRYAKFYLNGSDLILETGTIDPRTTLETRIICQNVTSCIFKNSGQAVQMILQVDDGINRDSTVVSAIMNN